MTAPVIIDIVIAAVLLGFLIAGGRRGLFLSLAGLAAVIVALVGAGMVSSALTPPAAKVLQPWIEKRVEARMDSALSGAAGGSSSAIGSSSVQMPEANGSASSPASSENTDSLQERLETQKLLKLLGLDEDPARSLADSAQEKVRDTGVSVLTAVAESMAENILHVLLFALSFFLILLLLKFLMYAVNLALKLPGLHLMNLLGGAVVGLLEGGLCLFLAIWILRRFGVSFETGDMSRTVLLHFFTTNTPLSALSFLQL